MYILLGCRSANAQRHIYALPEYGGGTDHINDGQSLITDDIKKL
jgi:hypothetical protein